MKAEIRGKEEFRKKKGATRIAFWSSQERPMIPNAFPFNGVGAQFYYRSRIIPGPGYYDTEYVSNLQRQSSMNTKGWGFGIRTDPRFRPAMVELKPGPMNYQQGVLEPKVFKPAFKPFGVSTDRFRLATKNKNPGPGTYDITSVIGKKVELQQCFGGTPPSLIPVYKRSNMLSKTRYQKRKQNYLEMYEGK